MDLTELNLANKSGSENGNEISLQQLLLNLVNSGKDKHVKLASDLLDLNLVQESISDNIGLNGSDKVLTNENENIEKGIPIDNTTETNMEWTTVKPKNKRVRSNSNDSEKINLEITVSPNKKQKSARQNNKDSVLVAITEIPENTYFNSIKMENMIKRRRKNDGRSFMLVGADW